MAAYNYSIKELKENMARAVARDAGVSTKYAIETVHFLKNRTTAQAKAYLDKVIAKKAAIPFRRFTNGVGHRKGPNMAAGRYPRKLSLELIRLIKNVEANASMKGLGDNLKIIYFIANKAAVPMRYGRHPRRETKRTHIEIIVEEVEEKRVKSSKKADSKSKKPTSAVEQDKKNVKKITPNKSDKVIETSEKNINVDTITKDSKSNNSKEVENKLKSEETKPLEEPEDSDNAKMKSTPKEESKND